MSGDIEIFDQSLAHSLPTVVLQTEAGATDIAFGEPVKQKAAGSPYVIPLADAEPVIGTTTAVFGIAQSDSSHTASADGTVAVWSPQPGVVYLAEAKDSAAVDTQAKYDALVGDRVLLDLTSSTYTVDESAGDSANNGIRIVALDISRHPGKVAFIVRNSATYLN